MNLLIAFVILLCLCISELRDPELAQHLGQRLALLVAVACFVPGVAIFQTEILSRRCRDRTIDDHARQRIFSRLSISHSAVWLAASVAIVWGIRWPDIVRVNWRLDRYPLLDDLLILAPILLSLFFSWAIFYDVKRLLDGEAKTFAQKTLAQRLGEWKLAERLNFVGIRFRVYVLMSLIPILATLLVRDAANFAQLLPVFWKNTVLILGGCTVMAFFPLLMLLAWKHRPVEDPALRLRLMNCCRRLKLGVWTIRGWDTGNQIINAVVAGVIPGLRMIIISDAMLGQFPQRELLAVVRHEAGHIRMCHVPIRMFFMLFPLIVAAIDQTSGGVIANLVTRRFETYSLTATHAILASAIAYVLYLLLVLSWLSKQMEFEADWFSVMSELQIPTRRAGGGQSEGQASKQMKSLADASGCDRAGGLDRQGKDDEPADDLSEHDSMTLAIARLAAHSPDQFDRRTLMHPSLRQRMQRTSQYAQRRVNDQQLASTTAQRVWLVRITFGLVLSAVLFRHFIG